MQRGVRQVLIEAVLVMKVLSRPALAGVRLTVSRETGLILVVVILPEVRVASLTLAIVRATVASDAAPESLSWRRHLPGINRQLLIAVILRRCLLSALLLYGVRVLRHLLAGGDLDWKSCAGIDQRPRSNLAGHRTDGRTEPGGGLSRRLSGEKRGVPGRWCCRDVPDAAWQLHGWRSGHWLRSGQRVENVARLRGSRKELVLGDRWRRRQQREER